MGFKAFRGFWVCEGFGLFAVSVFWCLECLGFEVLRVRVFSWNFRVSGFRVFSVNGFEEFEFGSCTVKVFGA